MNRFLRRRASTTTTTALSRWFSSPAISSLSNNKLFVGGLSSSVDNMHLVEAFSSFGDVNEVYDKSTGRSRGYGFVRFSEESAAVAAKDAMDGKALLGRPITIRFMLGLARGGPVVVPRFSNRRE